MVCQTCARPVHIGDAIERTRLGVVHAACKLRLDLMGGFSTPPPPQHKPDAPAFTVNRKWSGREPEATLWLSFAKQVERVCQSVVLAFPLFGSITYHWEMIATGLVLIVEMTVPDRHTGRPLDLELQQEIGADQFLPSWSERTLDEGLARELIARHVRRVLLREILEHELDEMLLVNGKRKDPHEHDL